MAHLQGLRKTPSSAAVNPEYQAKFAEVTATSIDAQAKTFLQRFVLDFQGRFEEVLDLAEEFKKSAKDPLNAGAANERELNEFMTHLLLEKRGETLTVVELRNYIKEIDLDKNHNVSFIEYALWKYKKTLPEFLKPSGASPELLKALEAAIALYQQTLAEKQARLDKMAELERIAAMGGVKGMAAKNQLEQMQKEDQLAANKKEITAAAAKRSAQKAVEKDDGSAAREKALKEEAARLEAEKKAKEEADAKKAADSRARLKAKASLWQ